MLYRGDDKVYRMAYMDVNRTGDFVHNALKLSGENEFELYISLAEGVFLDKELLWLKND